ncbi:cell division protein FtsQ [Prevotella sp. KH2C16]|uniref:cell division protein FtsQ n=1 Tax=Prevotella sp. KH2C16 TaxID=1855325 RepID=UPI0008E250C3|nr:cell division protein FtsQ [Prevotella sp. KH2C16]SFG04792.1 cell division protein FtsQ [Prevotella sp. KH2C16]
MKIDWRKTLTIALDVVIGGYLILAFTAFNKPDETVSKCNKVSINIQDETTNGFINTKEIKNRLERNKLYPLEKPMKEISARNIEDALKATPFVKTAECYKTQDGHVCITLTQRMPTVRIKANNGDDYYIDDKNNIMPNSHYTSDLIIATGNISRWYAQNYISYLNAALCANDLWRNQIVQINILPDKGVELVPRVGNHVIYIGQLPESNYKSGRKKLIEDFVKKKMERLLAFYKYGLSQAGWNKYNYINLEFDNQIICKKNKSHN